MTDSNTINTSRQEATDTERNFKLIRFWKTGNYSKASLGRMFHLSRERVRKVVEVWSNDPINEPEEHDGKI